MSKRRRGLHGIPFTLQSVVLGTSLLLLVVLLCLAVLGWLERST